MKVKICGITDINAALCAIETGADALGFVFAESKRRIDLKSARDIIDQLPENILKVGVFVNESFDTINQIIEETRINVVQLHGDEAPIDCEKFSVPVVKAFRVGSEKDLEQINDYNCEYILLDSPKEKYYGGNGKAFNWEIVRNFPFNDQKVILAGGLNEENVITAIERVNPYMIDVSSGVEIDGKKDLEKITKFIAKAKAIVNIS